MKAMNHIRIEKGALVFDNRVMTPAEWNSMMVSLIEDMDILHESIIAAEAKHESIIIPDFPPQPVDIQTYLTSAAEITEIAKRKTAVSEEIERLKKSHAEAEYKLMRAVPQMDVEFVIQDGSSAPYIVKWDADDDSEWVTVTARQVVSA